MSQTNTDITEYTKLYNQTWPALLESSTSLREYPNRNILTTWTLSYQEMEKACPNAAQMLQLWSCFDHNDLWYELFATPLLRNVVSEAKLPGWYVQSIGSQVEFTRVIQVLLNYSLAQPHSMPSPYSVHPVVHKWCYHRILKNRNMIYRLGLFILGSAVPQANDLNFCVEGRRLLSHCNQLSKHIKESSEISHGQNDEDKLIPASYHSLGNLYSDQCKLQEAEAMYQRALEGKEKAWGPDHTSTLDTIHCLGILYSKQGKLQEAEAMYQRALEGKEKAWGPDHTSTLDTVNNLGLLYSDQGKLQEAEAMYQRALEGKEKAWGPDHTSTLATVHSLSLLYSKQGKLQEAEAMYQRALEGKEKAWGPDHTSTLATIHCLGILYSDQGKLQEAEAMYQRALEGYENSKGVDHPTTLLIRRNQENLHRTKSVKRFLIRLLRLAHALWVP